MKYFKIGPYIVSKAMIEDDLYGLMEKLTDDELATVNPDELIKFTKQQDPDSWTSKEARRAMEKDIYDFPKEYKTIEVGETLKKGGMVEIRNGKAYNSIPLTATEVVEAEHMARQRRLEKEVFDNGFTNTYHLTSPVEALTIHDNCKKMVDEFKKYKWTPKIEKKRRKNMFGKIKKKDQEEVEKRLATKRDLDRSQVKMLDVIENTFAQNRKDDSEEFSRLEADIHLLKYPMGEIDKWGQEDKWFGMSRMAMYIYANKKYSVHGIDCFSITGYRKQGDYIQIRWETITVTTNVAMVALADSKTEVFTQIFLLKDELIPLEGCTVEFESEFIEVK